MSAVPSSAREAESEDERTSRILKETTRRIRDLGRAGKPREALDTLASMAEQYKVKPDAFAVTALIDACARNNNMDMARNVFEELFGTGEPFCVLCHTRTNILYSTELQLALPCMTVALEPPRPCLYCFYNPSPLQQVSKPRLSLVPSLSIPRSSRQGDWDPHPIPRRDDLCRPPAGLPVL